MEKRYLEEYYSKKKFKKHKKKDVGTFENFEAQVCNILKNLINKCDYFKILKYRPTRFIFYKLKSFKLLDLCDIIYSNLTKHLLISNSVIYNEHFEL